MAIGQITRLDTLALTSVATNETTLIEVRSGIIAAFFTWADPSTHIGCTTFSYDTDGVLTKLDEKELTGITAYYNVFSAIKIADGVAAFTTVGSSSSPFTGRLATVSINSSGIITAAVIDNIQIYASGLDSTIVHAVGNYYAITYGSLADNTSRLITVDIDSSGNIGSVIDTYQPTTNYSIDISILKIASGVVAIFYNENNQPTYFANVVETLPISSSDGTIGAQIDESVWGNEVHYDLKAFPVSGTIYACAFRDGSTEEGTVTTFDIAADGTITTADVDTLQFEATNIPIEGYNSYGAFGNGIAVFSYSDYNFVGQIRTVDIDPSGNIGATTLDSEIANSAGGNYSDYDPIIKVSETMFIILYGWSALEKSALSIRVAETTFIPKVIII